MKLMKYIMSLILIMAMGCSGETIEELVDDGQYFEDDTASDGCQYHNICTG